MKSPSGALTLDDSSRNPLLLRLRHELRRAGDPNRASAQQAYMKSEMPYYGVRLPVLGKICKQLFADVSFSSRTDWRKKVLDLWRGAQYREERYSAVALTGVKHAAQFQVPAELPLYEELIVTGAWWDYVDGIAARRVGPILQAYPEPMRKKMLSWSRSENLWKRRTSILCQLGFKQNTNLDLLYACIEASLDSREFFLRKAIGWALRQYAWTDPAEVRRYVRRNKDRLSGLSRREALKNI
jgi:3-methyladenine DNA glycosylase AlkD